MAKIANWSTEVTSGVLDNIHQIATHILHIIGEESCIRFVYESSTS